MTAGLHRSARAGAGPWAALENVVGMTTTPEVPGRTVLTFRTPEDVLAAVPVLLSFVPSDSVVMLTFGGRETFHARIDLPPPTEVDAGIGLLLDPALAHGVAKVLFVVYTARPRYGARLLDRFREAFEAEGIRVVFSLRADGRRYYQGRGPGTPYDVTAHPFRARAVLEGQVVTGSRDELAARLGPTDGVVAVEALLGSTPPYDATEVAATTWRALGKGRFDDAELAGVLQGIVDLTARDAAWGSMTRDDAADHVTLWTDALQRSPAHLAGGPAAVLALAAWLAGHGALAWCAVDRCVDADPDNSLARLVGELLGRAVPPSTWSRSWSDRQQAG
jgi:hypothetical protein